MPKISVIIPSYNHERFIGSAVQSVLDQTEGDLELIVVDDGSKDNSLDVLRGFHDPRIIIHAQENRGAHAAINQGLQIAASPYLAILNSDDLYAPDRLATLLAILEKDPSVGLCGSYIEVIDVEGKTLGVKHGYHDLEPWTLPHAERSFRAGEDLHAALLTENYWSTTSNYVFSREWYEKVGAFQPLRYVHDWDFALRMSRQAGLYLHPEPLMQYRIHSSNTIRENQAAMIFEICWILAVHLPEQMTTGWFNDRPGAERLTQLLHSIHVFDMDRVLSVMLAQDLSDHPDLALRLLDPGDALRAAYLGYITEALSSPAAGQGAEVPGQAQTAGRWARLLRKIANRLKRVLNG